MYLSCFVVKFSLHAIICEYLISLSIIINIELYLSLIAKFVDLSNLIIKFIVILFHDNLNDF